MAAIKMLADGVQECYRHIKSSAARATDGVPAALTVGEANSKAGVTPAVLVFMAVSVSSFYMAGSTMAAYVLYTQPSFSGSYLWCLPAIMLWGVYMALVTVVMVYMDLFLPNAPVAVREAIVNVGWCWIGLPVLYMDHTLTYFGQTWMVITMICLLSLLIAGVLAIWMWLVRTYYTPSS